jgi:hypothetical protein
MILKISFNLNFISKQLLIIFKALYSIELYRNSKPELNFVQ